MFQFENLMPVEIPCSFQAFPPLTHQLKSRSWIFYSPWILCSSTARLGDIHRFVQFSLQWDEGHPVPPIFLTRTLLASKGNRIADFNGDVQIKCLMNTTSLSLGSLWSPSFPSVLVCHQKSRAAQKSSTNVALWDKISSLVIVLQTSSASETQGTKNKKGFEQPGGGRREAEGGGGWNGKVQKQF